MSIKLLEKHIQSSVISYLTMKHYFFWRNNTGALKTQSGGFVRFGAVGSPDICLIKDGIFYGLEIKLPEGKQSEHQVEFEKNLSAAGGKYYIIRSLDDVIKIL